MRMIILIRSLLRFLLLTAAGAASVTTPMLASQAAAKSNASILLWPVDPVIEAETKASALWVENTGKNPTTLQVRVLAWAQADGNSVYSAQQDVVASPPIVTVAPGTKQLIRLMRMAAPPEERERAYRILIDEVPNATKPETSEQGANIAFRMRYSLPLFTYAKSAGTKAEAKQRESQVGADGALSWRLSEAGGERFLEIRNDGPIHARIVNIGFGEGSSRTVIASGLFGYVLAGSWARWPIDKTIAARGPLTATINGAAQLQIKPQAE